MAGSATLCTHAPGTELWITYHQASRTHKQVTAQLVDVSDAAQLFDLEDVLDYVFQQGFVDPKWRSVSWWEDSSAVRLKASSAVQDLLARGAGSTAESSLHLIVGMWRVLFIWLRLRFNKYVDVADVPLAIWVHYEYLHSVHPHTATQRIRLDLAEFKCERLAHITNYIFAKGYLPSNTRSLVSWKGASGKHIDESTKVDEVLTTLGEGLLESKPVRLVIGKCPIYAVWCVLTRMFRLLRNIAICATGPKAMRVGPRSRWPAYRFGTFL